MRPFYLDFRVRIRLINIDLFLGPVSYENKTS